MESSGKPFMESKPSRPATGMAVAAAAAFSTYFCMYAFRKPFSAGTFEGLEMFGLGLKSVLVISQGLGYMVSKFIGIKVISEMKSDHRGRAIIGLIAFAELTLVGFAYAPIQIKPLFLFLNGLPLGMVFGLVLGYLEGRKQTEFLSAVLCASFISSSGVMKSVGRSMIRDYGYSEYIMPMLVGLMFLPLLVFSVWLLQRTPPPAADDIAVRRERKAMTSAERQGFVMAYWPGLTLLVLIFCLLTVIRTLRDDFGVEIWRDLGVEQPQVFAQSESMVTLVVIALNGLMIWVPSHLKALRLTFTLIGIAFLLVAGSVVMQMSGALSPMAFMILCGIGLYIPYAAFHTTIFERLIAASGRPCNLGFLMYIADSIGYLGYMIVLIVRELKGSITDFLPLFQWSLMITAAISIVSLIMATFYFQRTLGQPATTPGEPQASGSMATAE